MTTYFAVQGLHSWHHLEHFFHEKNCHHSFKTAKHQITHQHEKFEKCTVCHFSLDSFVNQVSFYSFSTFFEHGFKNPISFVNKTVSQCLLGKKLLRAPPFN